ncbi:MAG: hypothetical protein ABL951_02660 [Alphaproteobacteria bacterium]
MMSKDTRSIGMAMLGFLGVLLIAASCAGVALAALWLVGELG